MDTRRVLMAALILSASVLSSKAAPLGVCFNDEFNGDEVNESVWNTRGNIFVGEHGAAPGSIKIDATSKILSQIDSQITVAPETGQTVELSFVGLSATAWGEGMSWGLSNVEATDFILLQCPVGQSEGSKELILILRKDGGEEQRFRIGRANETNGSWRIEWSIDRVVVLRDGNPVFDSNDGGTDTGESWRIPTAPLSATASTYINDNAISIESISLGVIAGKGE